MDSLNRIVTDSATRIIQGRAWEGTLEDSVAYGRMLGAKVEVVGSARFLKSGSVSAKIRVTDSWGKKYLYRYRTYGTSVNIKRIG